VGCRALKRAEARESFALGWDEFIAQIRLQFANQLESNLMFRNLLRRLQGRTLGMLEAGSKAPPIQLDDTEGKRVSVAEAA